jgi:hypothetical protein
MSPEQTGKRWGVAPAKKPRAAGKAELEQKLQSKRRKLE